MSSNLRMAPISDECNLNESGEFSQSFPVIYPNELQLKYEHHGLHATFRHLDITADDVIYEY